MLNNPGAATPEKALHDLVEEERKRRGLTQAAVAAQLGMSLRAYGSFVNGHSDLQPRNRRAVTTFLAVGRDEDAIGEETRSRFPDDVQVILDVLGVVLTRMEEEERRRFIHDLTRRLL